MTINEILIQNNISKYRLAKMSGIPYSTLNDICSNKTSLEKCSAETVYRLAKELNIPMEELLESYVEKRCSFELFKSNVCHMLKTLGDTEFIVHELMNDEIREYYNKKWYPECLYLLAMVDYISRINQIDLCSEYDDIRLNKLSETVFPSGILALYAVNKDESIKTKAINDSIPEFMRFNIVESEIRNVI